MKPHGFLVYYLNEKVAIEINGNINIKNGEISQNVTNLHIQSALSLVYWPP